MEPTTDQIDELAKVLQAGQTGDIEGWQDLYLTAESVIATCDSLDSLLRASQDWAEASPMCEVAGGLFWERVQAVRGQPWVALAVIDCGEFRLSYQQ